MVAMTAPARSFAMGGMVPSDDVLPDVLPTDRLNEVAKPLPEVREPLRRIASWRNVGTVAGLWLVVSSALNDLPQRRRRRGG